MASSLGGLIVSLGLDAAAFITGMTKAELQAKKFGDKLEKGINEGAKKAAAGFVAIEAAVLASGVAIDALIHKASNFKDIEERTGASAEALASFSIAAAAAGVTVDDIGGAMNKLAKNLTGVDDESKAAGAALDALGIPIKEFKELDPAKQMEVVAKALGGFQDGAQKAAVAMALFGKSGAQLLPFFKELESGIGRQTILTQKQINQADEFADAQKRSAEKISLYAQAISVEAIPVIQAVIDTAKEFVKKLFDLEDAAGKLDPAKIRDFAETGAKALAFLIDAGDLTARAFEIVGKTIGAVGAAVVQTAQGNFATGARIMTELVDDIEKITKRELFSTQLERNLAKQKELAKQRSVEDRGFVPNTKKKLDFEGAQKKDKGTEALAKERAILEQGLKAQENVIRDTQDALKDQEHFLSAYYEQDLISIRDFYSQRAALQEEAQQKTVAALNKEVELQRAFASSPRLKESDRIQEATKLADLEYKRDRAVQDGLVKAFDLQNELTKATQRYKDAVAEVGAQMKDLAGDTAAAAAVRFDLSHRDLVNRATTEGDQSTLDAISALRAQEVARNKLGEAARTYGRIQQQLGIDQARIDLAQHSGEITSLEAINKRSAKATEYVTKLQQQLAVQEQIAQTLRGQDQVDALAGIEQLRLQIDSLAESANELENSFRSAFTEAVSNNLADAIDGTKKWGQAFNDAVKQITRGITNLATQNIAESLFGKSGPAGGAAGFVASLFGGGTTSGGGGGGLVDSLLGSLGLGKSSGKGGDILTGLQDNATSSALSLATVETSSVSAAASLAAVSAAATTAATALAAISTTSALSSAGSGAGGFLSNLFGGGSGGDILSGLQGFAEGGTVAARKAVLVGEKGPEIFQPFAAGNIVPNNAMGSGSKRFGDINISVSVPGNVSRTTANQIAVQVAAQLSRATAKDA